ncbi:hypothetical protein B0H14DRAFT_3431434 [Mycena olivaceomarginata]|nr:hypothetical protein B0H14DRAFT_3431434 [Mycena olivaceomarginata]
MASRAGRGMGRALRRGQARSINGPRGHSNHDNTVHTLSLPISFIHDCFACPRISRLRVPLSDDAPPAIFAASKRAIRTLRLPGPGMLVLGVQTFFPGAFLSSHGEMRVQVCRAFFTNASWCTSSLVALSPMAPSTRISQRGRGHRSFVGETLEAMAAVDCAPWGRRHLPAWKLHPHAVLSHSVPRHPLSLLFSDMWPVSVLPPRNSIPQRSEAQRLVEKTRNDTGSSDAEPPAD